MPAFSQRHQTGASKPLFITDKGAGSYFGHVAKFTSRVTLIIIAEYLLSVSIRFVKNTQYRAFFYKYFVLFLFILFFIIVYTELFSVSEKYLKTSMTLL